MLFRGVCLSDPFFFFNDTATTEIYTLSLHDALPITAGLLTPDSLAELMGAPNIAPVQSNLQTPPGYPNAYDQVPIAPVIGQQPPQVPIPPPPPGPEVVPGPVAPTPAPVAAPAPNAGGPANAGLGQ